MYMFKEVKTSDKGVEQLATDMYNEFKYCFSKDSTEGWIKKFAHKRFERIRDEQMERFNKKLSKNFENKVVKRFTELIQEHVKECRKAFNKAERERIERERDQAKSVRRGKR